jgi:cAMP phosphodiesterase
MRIKILKSSTTDPQGHFSASYLVNDHVVIDAGSIGFSSLEVQRNIRHVILSHAHFDHICSLPILIDNIYEPGPDCVKVYASSQTADCLQQHVFNDNVWPDLLRLSSEESPFVNFVTLRDREPVQIEDLTVTPVTLNHIIPTFGFILEDNQAAVAIVSDTAATDAVWELARTNEKLKAVFLECAFPNSMQWLADKACHLTADAFLQEYRKLDRDVLAIAIHIKPAFHDQVAAELQSLGIPSLIVGKPQQELTF